MPKGMQDATQVLQEEESLQSASSWEVWTEEESEETDFESTDEESGDEVLRRRGRKSATLPQHRVQPGGASEQL